MTHAVTFQKKVLFVVTALKMSYSEYVIARIHLDLEDKDLQIFSEKSETVLIATVLRSGVGGQRTIGLESLD
jgi:hypothetical protein